MKYELKHFFIATKKNYFLYTLSEIFLNLKRNKFLNSLKKEKFIEISKPKTNKIVDIAS